MAKQLEVRDLSLWFGDHKAVEGVTLTIQAKQVTALAGVKLMGSDGCNEAAFFKTAKSAGDGVYLSSPVASPGAASALYTQFQAAYKSQYGTPQASFGPNGFDAFNLLKTAIEKAAIKQSDGSLQIPRTALRDQLLQIKDYQGLTGPLTCINTGDCQSQLAVNIGVYLSPNAPTNEAATNTDPIFQEKFSLTDALAG